MEVRRVMTAVAAVLAVLAAALAVGPVAADERGGTLVVMTQNAYMGPDPFPGVRVRGRQQEPATLLAAASARPRWAPSVDFPTRAAAMADSIALARPDVIGLQEVSRWVGERSGVGLDLGTIDFLPILLQALQARGLAYSVAAERWNGETGPFPYVDSGASCRARAGAGRGCTVTVQDRDVVLVNTQTPGLSVRHATVRTPSYVTQVPTVRLRGIDHSFTRGFAAVDLVFRGVSLRFASTHLTVDDHADVQEAQGLHLAGRLQRGTEVAVLTGDINSPADGSGSGTYRALLRAGLTDAWVDARDGAGLTCCQGNTLANVNSRYRMRIDVVLLRGAVTSTTATTVNAVPFRAEPAPIWASDHAGVVATLQVG